MNGLLFTLTLVAALGCGLNAGSLFAFSSFVMPALARVTPAVGVTAMQSMNKLAVTPAFMTALFGTALVCVATGGWALTDLGAPAAPYLLAGSALYLVGVIGLTAGFHQPRNLALGSVDPEGPDTPERWRRYVAQWSAWNHLRVVAGLAAAAAFTVAAVIG